MGVVKMTCAALVLTLAAEPALAAGRTHRVKEGSEVRVWHGTPGSPPVTGQFLRLDAEKLVLGVPDTNLPLEIRRETINRFDLHVRRGSRKKAAIIGGIVTALIGAVACPNCGGGEKAAWKGALFAAPFGAFTAALGAGDRWRTVTLNDVTMTPLAQTHTLRSGFESDATVLGYRPDDGRPEPLADRKEPYDGRLKGGDSTSSRSADATIK